MPLPDVTHLQFLILGFLLEQEQSGRALRDRLSDYGELKTAPAFYQMMSRLEDSGWVRGRYEQKVIDGQPIKERRYRITAGGSRTWESVRDFYLEQARLRDGAKGGFAGI